MNFQLIATAIALSLAIGGVAGYQYRDDMAAIEAAKTTKAVLDETKAQSEQDHQQSSALLQTQAKEQVVYNTIIKEVPKYVPVIQKTDSGCNLTHGVVSLFIAAAADDMPDTTGLDDITSSRFGTDFDSTRKGESGPAVTRDGTATD